jgi:hypothetical protein
MINLLNQGEIFLYQKKIKLSHQSYIYISHNKLGKNKQTIHIDEMIMTEIRTSSFSQQWSAHINIKNIYIYIYEVWFSTDTKSNVL